VSKHCSIKGIITQALSYKQALIKGNAVAILATLMTVMIPLFIPVLVDELLLQKSSVMTGWVRDHIMEMSLAGYVLFFLILTLILRTMGFFLNVIQVKTFLGISKDISLKLRQRAVHYLERVSLKEYEMISPSAITSKLVTDVNTVDSFIGTTVSKFVISILTLLFTAVILLMIHWKLAIFILITNPIVVFFTANLARNVGKLKRKENSATELFQSSLGETLELFHQIKAANKEQFFPVLSYWSGPFAPGGSGIAGGWMDYMALLNIRDGGVNGVKLTWEKCDFGYVTERAVECYERLKGKGKHGAAVFWPMSTGTTYALMERAHKDKKVLLHMGYGRTDATDGRVFPYAFPAMTNYWNQSSA